MLGDAFGFVVRSSHNLAGQDTSVDAVRTRVPELVAGVDILALPLDPLSGFVLSRIDGTLNLSELGDLTNLSVREVADVVDKLVSVGAVRMRDSGASQTHEGASGSSAASDPGRASAVPSVPPTASQRVSPSDRPSRRPFMRIPDEDLMEEGVEIPMERRREIEQTYRSLDQADYYTLLGVGRDAKKQEVRDSYFHLSKRFHPDTLFGKRLGSFKGKMEAVFKQLTEAYEVLGRKKRRDEYDAYLTLREHTYSARRSIAKAEAIARTVENETELAPVHTPRRRDGATSESDGQAVGESGDAPLTPTPAGEVKMRQPAAATARELAQKRLRAMLGSQRPLTPSIPPAPSVPEEHLSETDRRAAALRRLAGSLKMASSHTGGLSPADNHFMTGKRLAAEGDWVGAANALRLAVAVSDREDIADAYAEAAQRAAESLADTYEEQARYEVKSGKWKEAALSWSKVVAGRPGDVDALLHAAEAIVKAGTGLSKARNFAMQAVATQPDRVQARIVLARVYLSGGMKASARTELQHAAKLDPTNEIVKNLLQEVSD